MLMSTNPTHHHQGKKLINIIYIKFREINIIFWKFSEISMSTKLNFHIWVLHIYVLVHISKYIYYSYLSRPLPVIEGQNNPSYGLQRKNMVQNKIYDSMIPAMTSSNHKSSTINDVVLPPPPNYLHSTQNQQQINRPPPPYKGTKELFHSSTTCFY